MTAVDVPARRVTVGPPEAPYADGVELHTVAWVDGDRAGEAAAGPRPSPSAAPTARRSPCRCTVRPTAGLSVRFAAPQRRVAPGQTVALYDPTEPDVVLGSGIAG